PTPPRSSLFPYTTLFRSDDLSAQRRAVCRHRAAHHPGRFGAAEKPVARAPREVAMKPEWIGILSLVVLFGAIFVGFPIAFTLIRSEEHTSELQSRGHLVC